MLKLNVINRQENHEVITIDESSKFDVQNYVDPFAKEREIELKKFTNLLRKETEEAKKVYENARESYEKILENFIKKNITAGLNFKDQYNEAHESHVHCLEYESAIIFIDKLMTLEVMIENHELWINNDMFYDDEQ